MRRLLYFLYQYRAFIVFVLLASASVFLTVNDKLCKAYAAYAVGSVQDVISEMRHYPLLKEAYAKLLDENAMLRSQLLTVGKEEIHHDVTAPYHLIPTQVINNSIVGARNYLTLNKGAIHGVVPGMGVVSTDGIVGRVKAVSDHFAVVTSLLHTALQVSAQIVESNVLGTVHWSGSDPCRAQLLCVPRHVSVQIGDTVVTSGYNATFFAGALIGYVVQVSLREEAPFYDIELRLSTDFSTLRHVYVVSDKLKREKIELEQRTKDAYKQR
ncbi:MAG: rod shape-determining protein MreC [Bacteroidota bacterium]